MAKIFIKHVQDFFRKSLSNATFKRKLSSVSLPKDGKWRNLAVNFRPYGRKIANYYERKSIVIISYFPSVFAIFHPYCI